MESKHINSLFNQDEVARILDNTELSTLSSDSVEYGLAVVLNSDLSIKRQIRRGDAPYRLKDGEYALIATGQTMAVNYLAGVPDKGSEDEFNVQLEQPITEPSGGSTVRCKTQLELRISRHSDTVARALHGIMRKNDADRLTKPQFLKSVGLNLRERIQNFVQAYLDTSGLDGMKGTEGAIHFNEAGGERLSAFLAEQGLEFVHILCNVDRRSTIARFLLPSFQHDSRRAVASKLAGGTSLAVLVAVFVPLFSTGILGPEQQADERGTFEVVRGEYDDHQDWEAIVNAELGDGYRVADFNDLLLYHEMGGDLRELWREFGFPFATQGSHVGLFMTVNNEKVAVNTQPTNLRHYFVTVFAGDVAPPDTFLVHRQIDLGGHTLAVGSWFEFDRAILAVDSTYKRTQRLTLGLRPPEDGGSARLTCDSRCARTPGWTTEARATPSPGYEFGIWLCLGSCPTEEERLQPTIQLTINEDTLLRPIFHATCDTTQADTAGPPPELRLTSLVGIEDDWNAAVAEEFGSAHRIAEFADLQKHHDAGGDLLQLWSDLFEPSLGPRAARLAFNGQNSIEVDRGFRYYYAVMVEGEPAINEVKHACIDLGTHQLALLSGFSWQDNPQELSVLAATR